MAVLATIAPFGFPDFNPPTLFPIYRGLGCRTLQFYRNTKNPPDLDAVRDLGRELGMPFDSIHGVFGQEYDPSSPDPAIRRQAVETYRTEGIVALHLGGTMVVVHPTPLYTPADNVTPQTEAARVAPMMKSIEELARIGESNGVTYLIENIPPPPLFRFGGDPVAIAAMVREFNHPRVRMCFDTGHAHIYTPTPVDQALAACADVVEYFHVHDNDGKTDTHLVPGRGNLPWEALSKVMATKIRKDIPAMLELFHSEAVMKTEAADGFAAKIVKWMAV
ncbi:MAG: sugar phosphate isomerase/epimerase [Planctomycetes bacterium]|nr:sugar phosphate isomerase/epimerase [Planctomycetota bacterium]